MHVHMRVCVSVREQGVRHLSPLAKGHEISNVCDFSALKAFLYFSSQWLKPKGQSVLFDLAV